MRRFDVMVIFFAFAISTSVAFQNCADLKAAKSIDMPLENSTPLDHRVAPDFFTNQRIPLDNKIYTGSISFSVGGPETFTYETLSLATFETTLVKIYGINNQARLEVKSDSCNSQKNLSDPDVILFSTLFSDSFSNSQQKISQLGELSSPHCSFPRLVFNASALDGDVEIFYSNRECSPENELYIADSSTLETTLKSDVQTFFQNQINEVCNL